MIIILLGVTSEEEKNLINEIFSRLNAQMYNVSYKVLRNKHDVEEALSETFLKVMQNIDKISALPHSQIEPYCVRILKNETINIIRKRDKIIFIEDMDYIIDYDKEQYDIEDEFLKSADIERLQSCINRLSDDEQDFIHLRFAEERGLRDIAEFFDITEEAAKKRNQRIMKKLKKYYEGADASVQYD